MFRRAFCSLFVLVLLSLFASYVFWVRLSPSFIAMDQKREKPEKSAKKWMAKHPIRGHREKVQKELWISDGKERTHFELQGKESELIIMQKEMKIEAHEKMLGLKGHLFDAQEFEAATGTSYYPSLRLETEGLKASLFPYSIEAAHAVYEKGSLQCMGRFDVDHPMGHLRGEKASLQKKGGETLLLLEEGASLTTEHPFSIRSEKAFCTLGEQPVLSLLQFPDVQFFDHVFIEAPLSVTAEGGFALYHGGVLTLFPKEQQPCRLSRMGDKIEAERISFDLTTQELSCLHPHGMAHLEGRPIRFSSQSAKWHQNKALLEGDVHVEEEALFVLDAEGATLDAEKIHFQRNVRLVAEIQGKESFAVADEVIFYPKENRLLLHSAQPKRVLFWQEGFSLSAPEVEMWRGETPLEGKIEGKGDVHFAFDLEETKIIEQLLSNYL